MLVIVGYLVVCGSVFGGFLLAGGHMGVLMQPIELLMIGGAAVGASLVGNNAKTIKASLKALPGVLKGSKYNKALYMELMTMLFDICRGQVKTDSFISFSEFFCSKAAGDRYPKVECNLSQL